MAPLIKSIALALLFISPLSVIAAPLDRRQLAGEGAACNSVLSSTDNAVGYGVKNEENNVAGDIGGVPQTAARKRRAILQRRQGDKIVDGFANVANAVGQPAVGAVVKNNGDAADGDLTGDAAQAGAQAGDLEVNTVEGVTAINPTHA